MQFTKLRLAGFKSFVEPIEFVIEPGLTGVVGPNGCGKSNLVEALRWVMGESSYKNMRASGMDDVIFSGSSTRPARNSAEVTLTLDNQDHSAPVSFNDMDELQITRRIEREAGSIYRINGREVRARDVQLLFADQSTGARSPSMVGQGRIGEIIAAKPRARRALLEEAAGISGLHTRRHEAELRLRAAETNLERLDDIVTELATRIESLKRQARQANRFKMLSADIRRVEASLFYLRWSVAKSNEAEAQTILSRSTAEVGEKAQLQMQAARQQAINEQSLPPLREENAKIAATVQHIRLSLRQLEKEQSRLGLRQSELLKRLEQFDADIKREQNSHKDYLGLLEELAQEEADLLAQQEEAQAQSEQIESLRIELESQLQQHEQDFSQATRARAEQNAQFSQVRQRIVETQHQIGRHHNSLDSARQQLAHLQQDDHIEAHMEDLRQQVEELIFIIEDAEQDLLVREEQLDNAVTHEQKMRESNSDLRQKSATLQAEARTLQQIISSGLSDAFTTIEQSITVTTGYEKAVGAVFGDYLEAALDEEAPIFWRELEIDGAAANWPDNSVSLDHYVKAPPALQKFLKFIAVVDQQMGEQLHRQLQPGQYLVSLEGDIWRWDGLVARADAPSAGAQRLEYKNRLLEVEQQISELKQQLEQSEQILVQAASDVEGHKTALRERRDYLRQTRQNLEQGQKDLAVATQQQAQFARQQQDLQRTIEQSNTLLEELQNALEGYEQQIVELQPDEAQEQAYQQQQHQLSELRQKTDDVRAQSQIIHHQAQNRTQRLQTILRERSNWQMRAESALRQVEELQQRREETLLESEELAQDPENMLQQQQMLQEQLVQAEQCHADHGDHLAQAEAGQKKLDKQALEAVEALAAAREIRARAEERLSAAQERRKDIENQIRENLGCAPHETLALSQLSLEQPLPEVAQIENQLERLRSERERLGAVNLRAQEEQAELVQRYDDLTIERDDVVAAIGKLRQAIQSLNREGRERLLIAFEKVDLEFKRLFVHLFGGGTAQLQLVESDDPLEAGLEILAHPPGKKPQTMTLLSGGEQALTAMALIFAVFLTNPAPICVLDEVDAPLDDHNVERYCNLLDEMAASTSTRFIVITHNPITMARMNRLFGVTMGEQGVSQMVSVDLRSAERLVAE